MRQILVEQNEVLLKSLLKNRNVSQMGIYLADDTANILISDAIIQRKFVAWLGAEFLRLSQKANDIALSFSLDAKFSGLSHSALDRVASTFRFTLHCLTFLSLVDLLVRVQFIGPPSDLLSDLKSPSTLH